MKSAAEPQGGAHIFDASVHKVTLNLSLEFDKSTFSLNVECQVEKGTEKDGEGVYGDRDQNETWDIWIQSGAEGG